MVIATDLNTRGESKGDKDSEKREDAEQRSSPAARKPGEPRAGAYQDIHIFIYEYIYIYIYRERERYNDIDR